MYYFVCQNYSCHRVVLVFRCEGKATIIIFRESRSTRQEYYNAGMYVCMCGLLALLVYYMSLMTFLIY